MFHYTRWVISLNKIKNNVGYRLINYLRSRISVVAFTSTIAGCSYLYIEVRVVFRGGGLGPWAEVFRRENCKWLCIMLLHKTNQWNSPTTPKLDKGPGGVDPGGVGISGEALLIYLEHNCPVKVQAFCDRLSTKCMDLKLNRWLVSCKANLEVTHWTTEKL